MVDYWLVRRGRINVPELYSEDPSGAYHYHRGVNPRAIAAFAPAALLAIILALVPNFETLAPFSWMIGAGIAALLYRLLAPRHQRYLDVNGESIAVDSVSH